MKLLLESWRQYLNEEVKYKKVSDEIFLHFTTPERAKSIKEMERLLKKPEGITKFGTDTIDAISLIWGEYVPGVQTTHYGEGTELVGVEFKTNIPPSYGYVEEVKWHLDELPVKDVKILSFEKAVEKINNAPEEIDEMGMVKYTNETNT